MCIGYCLRRCEQQRSLKQSAMYMEWDELIDDALAYNWTVRDYINQEKILLRRFNHSI
jgi:hypothetical protein